jgi:poly-gamma-glutamate capsule biosynthesis protein CapA/YwtB (metallophosphatase superfamily)
MSKWLTLLFKIMQMAPIVVAGIEQLHGEKDGATKKQLAMDALGLASAVAMNVLPDDQKPAAAAATQLASNMIDGVVSTFNAAGVFQTKAAAPAGAAAPVAALHAGY